MATPMPMDNEKLWKELSLLKRSLAKTRKELLKRRLGKNPFFSDLEYLLGAFLEMYEPHLQDMVVHLSQRGYAVDVSSGFDGDHAQYQTINGFFSLDYLTRNKLGNIGVRCKEHNSYKSLIFSPELADLDHIKKRLTQIMDMLPDKGTLSLPSNSYEAAKFRRQYVPQDSSLQRQRLFERLQYSFEQKIQDDLVRRIETNPHPGPEEKSLGVFTEALEPQVKQAVLDFNHKGYSTDQSGFINDACAQMIEGDFLLDDSTARQLKKIHVSVESNVSGYTRLTFIPKKATISAIKKEWETIVSYLPDLGKEVTPTMTRKAREFRKRYCE